MAKTEYLNEADRKLLLEIKQALEEANQLIALYTKLIQEAQELFKADPAQPVELLKKDAAGEAKG